MMLLLQFNNRVALRPCNRHRSGYVMVSIAVPGERWEVEFDSTGNAEVEIFKSGGPDSGLEGEEAIERLLREFSN